MNHTETNPSIQPLVNTAPGIRILVLPFIKILIPAFIVYYISCSSNPLEPPVIATMTTVRDSITHNQRLCLEITTPTGIYYLDKDGAGLISLLDRNGRDWIGWKPGNGPGGVFRGMPNIGGCCHPGYPTSDEGVRMITTVPVQTDSGIIVSAISIDSLWRIRYLFFLTHCSIIIESTPRPYWILYEGTPGGTFEKHSDYFRFADGKIHFCSESYSGDIPNTEWVCFGDQRLNRSLIIVHSNDDTLEDSYRSMISNSGGMTMFGFARTSTAKATAVQVPDTVSVALCESNDYYKISLKVSEILATTRTSVLGTH